MVCFQARQGAEGILGMHINHRECRGSWWLHLSVQREAEGAGAEAGRLQGWVLTGLVGGLAAWTPGLGWQVAPLVLPQ